MINENKLETLMNEFVDDLNNGKEPRLYEYLLHNPDDATEIVPLMKLVGRVKASTIEVNKEEKESIRSAILSTWTIRRLIELGSPETIQKATQSGLTNQQLENLRKDGTSININEPNKAVSKLSEKYGISFFNLLGWIRQLITDSLSATNGNNAMSPAYTRKDKNQQKDDQIDGEK